MATEPENLIGRYLRAIDEKLDRAVADIRDIKLRLSAVEQQIATINGRLDRIDDRLDRIEKRTGLIDAPRA